MIHLLCMSGQWSNHKYITDLCIGTLGHFLQVILCPCGNAAKKDLLRHTSAQRHTHPVQQLLLGVQVLLFRQILGIAQTLPTRDDGHLKRPMI